MQGGRAPVRDRWTGWLCVRRGGGHLEGTVAVISTRVHVHQKNVDKTEEYAIKSGRMTHENEYAALPRSVEGRFGILLL